MLEKGEGLCVVLVDDDSDDRLLFRDVFSDARIESSLLLFENGLQFLNHLDRPMAKIPDIIFLDLDMPVMSGLETLSHVRRSSKYRNVPVAIYATSDLERDIEETLSRGANIYLTKPNDIGKLRKAVDAILAMQWQYSKNRVQVENFIMLIE